MNEAGILQIVLFCALLIATAVPLGHYLSHVYDGGRTWLTPLERVLLACFGVRRDQEQHWTSYAISLLVFNLVTLLALYAILRLQAYLPFNPAGQAAMPADLAFNTAVSFTTNTNWQNYGGESSLSYFAQMAGLTVHNFTSAATGLCVAIAVIRGFSRRSARLWATSMSIWCAVSFISCCRCRSCSRCFWCGRACRKISMLMLAPPASMARSS